MFEHGPGPASAYRQVPIICVLLLACVVSACASEAAERTPPPPPPLRILEGPSEPPSATEAPTFEQDADLDELLGHALLRNPAIEAARQRWLAALERAPQVDSLPDPVLRTRYYVEEVETRVGPQEWALGLSQMVPWFGKLGLQGDVAAARADAELVRYQGELLTVLRDVKIAWFDLFYLERSIATVQENRDLIEYLEEVVRSRFSAGEVSYSDVLRAQVELGRLEDRLRSLEDRRRPLAARLNKALHRAVDAPVPRPTELPEEAPLESADGLRQLLEQWNPELRAMQHDLLAAEKGVELADLARRPDFTLGIDYIYTDDAITSGVSGSGDDPLIATVSLNLPLNLRRYRALEREARARQRSVRERIASETDRLRSSLEEELFTLRDADRQITLYRDTLVPRARQSFEATETAFRSGEASFLDLIDAERVLLEFELSFERARTDRSLAIARLERLVGAPITKEPEAEKPTPEDERGDRR